MKIYAATTGTRTSYQIEKYALVPSSDQEANIAHACYFRTQHLLYVLLDIASRSESPLQLIPLIAKQFPRIAVTTTKEGSRKIAENNFDPLNPAIDHILKDGESHTGTNMGTGYTILSAPKGHDRFFSLSRHLP
ncbi:hypothetical protein G6F43_003290 [Rhizopus delemar]|nr:hypothetical protein G6F43_003290 [Rhizopus delemar]